MSERGKMHVYSPQWIFGETLLRCERCGLIGDYEPFSTDTSSGYRGKPIYGCEPRHALALSKGSDV